MHIYNYIYIYLYICIYIYIYIYIYIARFLTSEIKKKTIPISLGGQWYLLQEKLITEVVASDTSHEVLAPDASHSIKL